MPRQNHSGITMRERQILDVLYRHGKVTASEVMKELPGKPSYSTVRTQLRILEEKGHVRHSEHRLRYVYEPMVPRRSVQKSVLAHMVDTFFEGSAHKVVAALLGREKNRIQPEELDRISVLIEVARKESRR